MSESVKYTKPEYSQEKSTKWLSWIARNMQKHDQTLFLIEELQTTWLPYKLERFVHRISFVILLGIPGALIGLVSGYFGVFQSLENTLIIFGIVFGVLFGLVFSLGKGNNLISTIELNFWSWDKLKKDYPKAALFGSILGSALTLILGIIIDKNPDQVTAWDNVTVFAISNGFASGLIAVFMSGWDKTLPQISTKPNEGISSTIKNCKRWLGKGFLVGLLVGLYISIIIILFLEDSSGNELWGTNPIYEISQFMIVYGIIGAFIGSSWFGAISVIRHYTLRFLIYIRGYGPWNYPEFLDYAVDELHFMRRVGGGYIFIHRFLLEHFADIEKDSTDK